MPDVEKATINELYITIYMACDIIESGVLDINDALHRVDKNLEIVQFDELKELAKEVKKAELPPAYRKLHEHEHLGRQMR